MMQTVPNRNTVHLHWKMVLFIIRKKPISAAEHRICSQASHSFLTTNKIEFT